MGETYVAFRDHVHTELAHQPNRGFPQFLQLAMELQLHILSFCDSATLFQLMHASSTTRGEARKLFWSDPNTRYLIKGTWLFSGGFSGHTLNAVDALLCMQHIQVHFGTVHALHDNAWEDGVRQRVGEPTPDVSEKRIRDFWQTLQRCFPCVTNVVLSKADEFDDAEALPPEDLEAIAERCPAGIRTTISCLQGELVCNRRLRQRLWRQVRNDSTHSTQWETVDLQWTRPSVLPPPKQFLGPVGAFCRLEYHRHTYNYLRWAHQLLLMQARDAYYLQELQVPYICPHLECDSQFERPGEWILHAIDTAHDFDLDPPPCETLEILFAKHSAKLAHIAQQCADASRSIRIEWGTKGSKQRDDVKQAFHHQLRHDALYTHEKVPEESAIWYRYQKELEYAFPAEWSHLR